MRLSLFGKAKSEGTSGITSEVNKEQVREWQRRLRAEQRAIERDVRRIDMEEAKVIREIQTAAKRGDAISCRILAKEVSRTRRAKNRMLASKAHMNSVYMSLSHNMAALKMASNMKASTDVMASMNKLLNAPEVTSTMREMAREMARMGLIEDAIEDAVDSLDADGIEEDADSEVHRVLSELAIDVASVLPTVGDKLPPQSRESLTSDKMQTSGRNRVNAL